MTQALHPGKSIRHTQVVLLIRFANLDIQGRGDE